MTNGTLTLAILVAILAQFAVAVLREFRRRVRQLRDLDARPGETPAILAPDVTSPASAGSATTGPAWEGFKKFVVLRREAEGANDATEREYLPLHVLHG